jgi:hypothetical protein
MTRTRTNTIRVNDAMEVLGGVAEGPVRRAVALLVDTVIAFRLRYIVYCLSPCMVHSTNREARVGDDSNEYNELTRGISGCCSTVL